MIGWLLACAPRLPSASLGGVELADVGWSEATAVVRVDVDNPLYVEVPTTGLRWTFDVDGRVVASGALADAPALGPDAVTTVPIPVVVRYADLAHAATAAEVPYRFAAEVDLATPFGAITLPVAHSGTLPAMDPPSLDLVDVGLGLDGTALLVDLTLDLRLPAGATVDELRFGVAVDERPIGSGTAAHADGRLRVPLRLEATSAAAASFSALLGTAGTMRLDLEGKLGTPLGTVPVRWSRDVAVR